MSKSHHKVSDDMKIALIMMTQGDCCICNFVFILITFSVRKQKKKIRLNFFELKILLNIVKSFKSNKVLLLCNTKRRSNTKKL